MYFLLNMWDIPACYVSFIFPLMFPSCWCHCKGLFPRFLEMLKISDRDTTNGKYRGDFTGGLLNTRWSHDISHSEQDSDCLFCTRTLRLACKPKKEVRKIVLLFKELCLHVLKYIYICICIYASTYIYIYAYYADVPFLYIYIYDIYIYIYIICTCIYLHIYIYIHFYDNYCV